MRYETRSEVEAAGRAGSTWRKTRQGETKAKMLNSFWLYLDKEDDGFVPHQTTKGEGYWEAWITVWMSQNVTPGSVCLDIGANVGYYTLFLLDHGCYVVAVEPQVRLANLIRQSVEFNGFDQSFEVDVCAVDEKPGTVTMTIPPNHGMNAWIKDLGYTEIDGATEIEVPCKTLNDFEGKYDFVKIDAEGVEERLFRGAIDFMNRNPDCVYLVEWGSGRLNNAEAACHEIYDLMEVSYVDFQGFEVSVNSAEQLYLLSRGDWIMLVLRKRK